MKISGGAVKLLAPMLRPYTRSDVGAKHERDYFCDSLQRLHLLMQRLSPGFLCAGAWEEGEAFANIDIGWIGKILAQMLRPYIGDTVGAKHERDYLRNQ
jgi:hypothetical protein